MCTNFFGYSTEELMESTSNCNLPTEVMEPVIPEDLVHCEGLPRRKWITKPVTLLNLVGVQVAKGICHCVDSSFVLGSDGPLGEHQVAVQISMSLCEEEVPSGWAYSMVAWPIVQAIYNGFSLEDHARRDMINTSIIEFHARKRKGVRSYTSDNRVAPSLKTSRIEHKLSQQSILSVASQVCCALNCVQSFPREKILPLREQVWRDTDFKLKSLVKLDVHRRFHYDKLGKKMVTVEGIDVCPKAWMLIIGVPKTTFYRDAKKASDGVRASNHGNLGSKKPRESTVQATATMRCVLENAADHMPHKARTLTSGEKVVSRSLPSSWKWKDVLPEVNDVNNQLGLSPVSASSLSKIRRTSFGEYMKKTPGDNFSRCSTCDKFDSLVKASRGTRAELLWEKKLSDHWAAQQAHRELYYANRYRSMAYPTEVVTIIHDKMDHAKTASPLFSHKTKSNDAWMKLPVAVTGMIAHGHGYVRYAHYGLDIYPSDSNHTVGSIAKLLRDLEGMPKSSSRDVFGGSGMHELHKALLVGKEICLTSLPPSPAMLVEAAPLPPILNVQMDNAASDNKNRFVFCFWSLLVARGVFREIYVNFLLVGHTHDDIDALFGRWSMKLKQNDYPTIPLLMKSFMDAERQAVIPHLIEEVPDFKGFIANYIASGDQELVGHSEGQQFKFYLHSNGWPMMQYKLQCTDIDWLPVEEGGIKLWKEDEVTKKPILPRGEPKPLPPIPMKNLEEIVKGLNGFVNHWRKLCAADPSGEYRRKHEYLTIYWTNVVDALALEVVLHHVLRNGFWPLSKVDPGIENLFNDLGKVCEEFARDEHFIGRRCDRPEESFRVGRDIYCGYFVVVRPTDDDPKPFSIARAVSDYDCNPDHPGCLQIQYFKPTNKSRVVQENYSGWNGSPRLKWRIDETHLPEWLDAGSIISSWKSNAKVHNLDPIVSIPSRQIDIISETLIWIREE